MGERENTVCVLGIGCYTAFAALMDSVARRVSSR